MNVELPETGCNILISESSFYNYSFDSRTRQRYFIYDGQPHLQSSDYSQYGYTYNGTCLHTGDLIYKPEYKDFWMPLTSLLVFVFILGLIYHIIIKRLLP